MSLHLLYGSKIPSLGLTFILIIVICLAKPPANIRGLLKRSCKINLPLNSLSDEEYCISENAIASNQLVCSTQENQTSSNPTSAIPFHRTSSITCQLSHKHSSSFNQPAAPEKNQTSKHLTSAINLLAAPEKNQTSSHPTPAISSIVHRTPYI